MEKRMNGTDRTIQNTFNAFYALKWGKNATRIDFRILRFLCKAQSDSDLQKIMQDILNAFRPWIDKEDEFTIEDWHKMLDASNELHKKYIYHPHIADVIQTVYMYIDDRERNKHHDSDTDTRRG